MGEPALLELVALITFAGARLGPGHLPPFRLARTGIATSAP